MLAGLAAALTGAAGLFWWAAPGSRPVEPAFHATIEPVTVGLGYLEPEGAIIKVAAPGQPDSARLVRLEVAEGDAVVKGQRLATLDSAEKLAAQLASARNQVALKRVALERQRRDIAYATTQRRTALERAKADMVSNRAEYDRQRELSDRNIATASNLEKKKRDYVMSLETVTEAGAALERIEARAAAPLPGQIDVAVAEQELALADADLAVAMANLDQAYIVAPIEGRIFALNARAGERIGSDGLLEMGDTTTMRAVVEVYQTDIARISIGQMVTLTAEALKEPVKGKVEWIAPAVKRQTIVNNDPASATDARVVAVHVALSKEDSAGVASLSRLQVRARFER